jgi:hypothetical protein
MPTIPNRKSREPATDALSLAFKAAKGFECICLQRRQQPATVQYHAFEILQPPE